MSNTVKKTFNNRAQSGVVLLEVMVAILIFSIGILGLVGMHASSVKNQTESQFRIEAAIWADTLISEMRVADPATRATSFATDGTAYNAWKTRLTATSTGLPISSSTPPTVTINNNQVEITIYWRALSDTGTHKFVSIAQLD